MSAVWAIAWMMVAASAAVGPLASNPSPSLLPVLLLPVEGDLTTEQRQTLTQRLEDALFGYTRLAVYTQSEFAHQIGWERQQKRLECQFPADCAAALKATLGISHEVKLALVPLADGRLHLKLNLIVADEGREFVQAIPEFDAAPVLIDNMIPDLIGEPTGLSYEQGVVRIASFPMGAAVSIGGRPLGRTPLSYAAKGGETLDIKVEREGHPPVKERVTIRRGAVARVFADLVTRQGQLLVDSLPPGASVKLDGRPAGTTPLVLDGILTGEHRVELSMPPYPDVSYNVKIAADDVARVRHGFVPETGTLVVGQPADDKGDPIEIFINNQKVAETLYRADLAPGEYLVHIVRRGSNTYEKKVTIRPGETVELRPALEGGLSLMPGQVAGQEPDYRPGGFTLALGALALGFGIFLEFEAQRHYDNAAGMTSDDSDRDGEERNGLYSRIGGGISMGLGSAAVIAGTVLLILPPAKNIAITPEYDAGRQQAMLRLKAAF
ncbi:MAG: PEGA domain-containing protein [Myxococcales bacterium]|nr:MAG: PEGA domain-containing protein [Myxococcales bacterium]